MAIPFSVHCDDCMWLSRLFFFTSRRRNRRFDCDWSSDVCSSDLTGNEIAEVVGRIVADYRAKAAAEKAKIAGETPKDERAQAVAATAQVIADKAADKAMAAEIGRASCRERV